MNKNIKAQPDILDKIFKDISSAKKELVGLIQKQNSLNYDIFDSENFIDELKQKNIDLTNSIAMRTYLPLLELTYCPMCLNPITPTEDKNICPICQKTLSKNDLTLNALRLKNELAFQIKESESLLAKKKVEVDKLKSNIAMEKKNIAFLQTKIDSYAISVQTTEQKERDASLFLKGNLSKEIEYLNRELSFQEKVNDDVRILENLKEDISILKNAIENNRKKIQRNYANAMSAIKEIATEFIKADLPRDLPSDDLSLSKLNIDFEKNNSFSIDEKNNFAASSMAYLKNSIMFAFFFSSIRLKEMNYPRFIMCDNIEDKGMEIDRSHKFQLNLYNKSNECKGIEHQIIITTSMLEPSLDKPEICVGKPYTQTSKSLNFGDSE
jgi:predicted  nucleic acid-binding Zn-ribbon protein